MTTIDRKAPDSPVLTPAQIEESRAMFRKGCRLGVEREDALCDAALRAVEIRAFVEILADLGCVTDRTDCDCIACKARRLLERKP